MNLHTMKRPYLLCFPRSFPTSSALNSTYFLPAALNYPIFLPKKDHSNVRGKRMELKMYKLMYDHTSFTPFFQPALSTIYSS